MARTSNALAKAKAQGKKLRVGETADYLLAIKHLGDEPDYSHKSEITSLDYTHAMNWYNYVLAKSDAREFAETYLKNSGRFEDSKRLNRVPDAWFPDQLGWIARLASRRAPISDKTLTFFNSLLTKTLTHSQLEETKKAANDDGQKVSVQDRMRDKVSNFIGEFEEAIDKEGHTLSMYEWLKKHQIPAMLANKVAEFYKPIAEETAELLKKNCDPQLKEGYSRYTAAQQKQLAAFYESILADCARHASNTKKQQPVVRKKKVVTADKKLKNLKYQRESKEFKVVSINPEKMLGSEELVTFNTKYNLLTVFIALDRGGLDVKGTTITNYDETKSKSYRIGRKTEESVEVALRGGKRAMSKMLESLKTCNLQHRINENTILLRV